jgi:hypothetical protein
MGYGWIWVFSMAYGPNFSGWWILVMCPDRLLATGEFIPLFFLARNPIFVGSGRCETGGFSIPFLAKIFDPCWFGDCVPIWFGGLLSELLIKKGCWTLVQVDYRHINLVGPIGPMKFFEKNSLVSATALGCTFLAQARVMNWSRHYSQGIHEYPQKDSEEST